MNVLLLTPDAVGGTLLQKMITVSMQLQDIDRPFIEVGHIELGLETYYNEYFNQMVLRCRDDYEYKEMQSLPQIKDILESVDHYSAIKLPFYNILSRDDEKKYQIPFYKYLNDNFFVISCRRQNLFEHSLSWALNKITHALNVYDPRTKVQTFFSLYKNGVKIDPLVIRQTLNDYKKYIDWCDKHFKVGSFYYYEKNMPHIEQYVLSLPIFQRFNKLNKWKDVYGQDFNDWNRCHYFISDMAPMLENNRNFNEYRLENYTHSTDNDFSKEIQDLVRAYDRVADPLWPKIKNLKDWINLPSYIIEECVEVHDLKFYVDQVKISMQKDKFGVNRYEKSSSHENNIISLAAKKHQHYLSTHRFNYNKVSESINQMNKLGILTTGIPIKKQTMQEKQKIIVNFAECMNEYNQWIGQYPDLGSTLTNPDIDEMCQKEQIYWTADTKEDSILLTDNQQGV